MDTEREGFTWKELLPVYRRGALNPRKAHPAPQSRADRYTENQEGQHGEIPLALQQGDKQKNAHKKLYQRDNKEARQSAFLGLYGHYATWRLQVPVSGL